MGAVWCDDSLHCG